MSIPPNSLFYRKEVEAMNDAQKVVLLKMVSLIEAVNSSLSELARNTTDIALAPHKAIAVLERNLAQIEFYRNLEKEISEL